MSIFEFTNENIRTGRLIPRRETAALFTSANPVIEEGRLAIESDTLQMKLGDGITAWADLPYISGGGGGGGGGEIPQFYIGGAEPAPTTLDVLWLENISGTRYRMKVVPHL